MGTAYKQIALEAPLFYAFLNVSQMNHLNCWIIEQNQWTLVYSLICFDRDFFVLHIWSHLMHLYCKFRCSSKWLLKWIGLLKIAGHSGHWIVFSACRTLCNRRLRAVLKLMPQSVQRKFPIWKWILKWIIDYSFDYNEFGLHTLMNWFMTFEHIWASKSSVTNVASERSCFGSDWFGLNCSLFVLFLV